MSPTFFNFLCGKHPPPNQVFELSRLGLVARGSKQGRLDPYGYRTALDLDHSLDIMSITGQCGACECERGEKREEPTPHTTTPHALEYALVLFRVRDVSGTWSPLMTPQQLQHITRHSQDTPKTLILSRLWLCTTVIHRYTHGTA